MPGTRLISISILNKQHIKNPSMTKPGNKKASVLYSNKSYLSFIFSLLLMLCVFNFIHSVLLSYHGSVIYSGIASTMEEAADSIKGFGRFLDSIRSIINTISAFLGIEVILLLIAASLISGGLSLLGIPKGKISFFCSLAIADIFWFIWAKSFNPGTLDFAGKLLSMFETNIILIIPFIFIYFFRSSVMSKKIRPKIKTAIKSIFGKKAKINKSMLIKMNEMIQEESMNLQRSIYNDVIYKKDDDEILISDETLKHKKELEEILREIKREL
jgi:hypothetical protein